MIQVKMWITDNDVVTEFFETKEEVIGFVLRTAKQDVEYVISPCFTHGENTWELSNLFNLHSRNGKRVLFDSLVCNDYLTNDGSVNLILLDSKLQEPVHDDTEIEFPTSKNRYAYVPLHKRIKSFLSQLKAGLEQK